MSKFCSSCGSSVPDETTFCPNCGAPANAPAPVATAPTSAPVTTAPANAAKLGKNTIMMIGAIAIGIIILIVLFANVLGGGYKKPVKNMFKAQEIVLNNSYDADIIKLGKNIKVKVKYVDKEKLDSKDIEKIEKNYKSSYKKTVNIKSAYELELKVKLKGSKDDRESKQTVTVGKINGKWYVLETPSSYNNYSNDDEEDD